MVQDNIVRKDLKKACEAGDRDTIIKLAREALAQDSDDLRVLVDAAIHLRYSDPEYSDIILHHILKKDPASSYGHYELAFSCLLRGDHLEGIHLLENLLRFTPEDARAITLHARFLCGIGASDLALMHVQSAIKLIPLDEAVLIEQFAAFINRLPSRKAVYLAARRPLEETQVIKSSILEALRSGTGFSLVRFGDGEGVFFQSSLEEEKAFASLFSYVRSDRARVWFGQSVDDLLPTFTPLALKIKDVFDACDVAGVPYRSWIEHEYKILSYTGIVGLGNIARHIGAAPRLPMLASQLVHIDLARSGALREILTGLDYCAIISCFPEARDLIATSFGIKQVDFFKVPGEKLFSEKIGAVAADGQHFPIVFDGLMQTLTQPLNRRLVLVAAGMLGKFYCARIKESGGVAIDIGSLIDAALGKATRPGYSVDQPIGW